MTNNQIQYFRHKEDQRHNIAEEQQAKNVLAENVRHNYATEDFNLSNLAEVTRHNIVSEGQRNKELYESKRHNEEQERLQQLNIQVNEALGTVRNAIDQGKLTLDQQKEAQRIIESLRDYEENVRHHNLQAATSSVAGSLYASLGGFGLTGTNNSLSSGLPALNATSTGRAILSKLSQLATMLPVFIPDQVLDQIKPIKPNSGNGGVIAHNDNYNEGGLLYG